MLLTKYGQNISDSLDGLEDSNLNALILWKGSRGERTSERTNERTNEMYLEPLLMLLSLLCLSCLDFLASAAPATGNAPSYRQPHSLTPAPILASSPQLRVSDPSRECL